ncbi:oligopeptidase A [Vibrio cyclitrophicus]|jgi:oligopeptidase A|uniref:oligopeptidase A n=2 Tax=Vibrio cyclitrophicus TaxID=47951 RepID=A0A7Z1MJY6_9VIBR|nr:oligopeptidase A [Vibrio cyclitrophicus]MBU2932999.1 oligopeptidase A [Vibrio cyclitrophicus]OBT19481.1 oligopeptidase A [Vibrio cyclitrophicus]OCH40018.1 oligopeptidase A [Vibrio cyclitrophicus]OEE25327.1 oligopeptidase A [Vibrio cyclitrophicus ZF170]OEF32322.1 oligopeptidase A [Vibrio cyclitrophicus 1F97]
MSNPLLTFTDLPPFSQIKPEHVKPAVEQVIEACRNKIEQVLEGNTSPSWDNLVAPIEEVDDRLGRIWSPVSHMNSVVNSDELREAYESCLPVLSEYGTWVGQHKGLFEAYKAIKASEAFSALNRAQQKTITDALRDFELSGIGLPADEQHRYGEISKRQSELGSQFSNNVLDATMGWSKQVTDVAELAGMPESALAAAQAAAQAKELEGYLLTLDIPSYLPVMTYCDNQALRKELYEAYVTRASDRGPNAGKWDNTEIITEQLKLRHEIARMLGFSTYSEKSLSTKMAETPDQVLGFLNDLAVKAKPQGEREVEELRQFAEKEFGISELNLWDIAYYSEKQKQNLFEISDEELRPYFPESNVVSGLFEVLNRVFGMSVTEREGVDTWHESVRFFDIFDATGTLRGSFYLDLYAREHKRGGAWMDDCRGRRITESGELQTPVAYLTCNFNKPVGDKPALFTHDEVVTLFHEFGHGIHHMLTQVDAGAVSGINGVPWDAVELPSQFLENWCWEEEALSFISGHFETGEALPKEMLEKMLAAKNFQSAMFILRQLELGLFDFTLHTEYDPEVGARVLETLADVKSKVSVLPSLDWNRFSHSFGHIFAGGYSAGYYSYLWAEVLSADAFSAFEEEGIFNTETGNRFLNNILEMGGSEEPMELFKRFRGREPQIDAMLRHAGINA